MLNIPDNVFNWIESFFRDHSHCTKFDSEVSEMRNILASVIHGSAVGPASFIVTAFDLHPITIGNFMDEYADDLYLIILASNVQSRAVEISHVEDWAN